MNFKEFVETGKLEKFRKVKLDLTEINTKYDELISEVDDELLELRNLLNNRLKKEYRGKLKIDFCITEYINKNKKSVQKIEAKFGKYILEANDTIAKAQTKVERKIRNEVEK